MCNCIKEINQKIKETGRNTQLDIPIALNKKGKLKANRVGIKVRKLDDSKREKPIPILPTFCPFCGEPYEIDEKIGDNLDETIYPPRDNRGRPGQMPEACQGDHAGEDRPNPEGDPGDDPG